MNKYARLNALLLSCFNDAAEVRHVIRQTPHGEQLVNALPGVGIGLKPYTTQVSKQLIGWDLADAAFFAALKASVPPPLHGRIDEVAAALGVG